MPHYAKVLGEYLACSQVPGGIRSRCGVNAKATDSGAWVDTLSEIQGFYCRWDIKFEQCAGLSVIAVQ